MCSLQPTQTGYVRYESTNRKCLSEVVKQCWVDLPEKRRRIKKLGFSMEKPGQISFTRLGLKNLIHASILSADRLGTGRQGFEDAWSARFTSSERFF
jgi:hypothetical protein